VRQQQRVAAWSLEGGDGLLEWLSSCLYTLGANGSDCRAQVHAREQFRLREPLCGGAGVCENRRSALRVAKLQRERAEIESDLYRKGRLRRELV
jgi:hypothetical protein